MYNIHALNFLDVFVVPEDTVVRMTFKTEAGWHQTSVKVGKDTIGRVVHKNPGSTTIYRKDQV